MYNNKIFATKSNTENGEVSAETRFHYFQKENIVWAEYSGGQIIKGFLIANVVEGNCLDMRYEHININGELMTGVCYSTPEILFDGRIILNEKWKWTCGDFSEGESVVEEIVA
ncbi:MAG: n-acetylglutamate synthase [Spirosomaceae bacterium]|jgi:hypothetical protein|nr:n-acetylglutamate synthase [Spirosomataceae bacterium]